MKRKENKESKVDTHCQYVYSQYLLGDFHLFICALHRNEMVMREITEKEAEQYDLVIISEGKCFVPYTEYNNFISWYHPN